MKYQTHQTFDCYNVVLLTKRLITTITFTIVHSVTMLDEEQPINKEESRTEKTYINGGLELPHRQRTRHRGLIH